jgi:hypothetical protein
MANKVKKFDVAKALNLASRFGVEEEVLEELEELESDDDLHR